ncbi:MAG TPA: YncE family protein [Nitrospirota bacterium]|nr:YncE family protein [Nitrospirota bacterium]
MKPFIAMLCLLITVNAYAVSSYHVINKLPIGGDGGWDYVTADSSAHRLYISRGNHVMVLDTETNKVIGDIPDTPGVHGIAIAPELNKGFISNGKVNSTSIFDLKTLKVTRQVRTGENPDAILYDPPTKRVFTFNGKSKDTTVIDATSEKVLGTMALGGKPEFAAADGKGKVFVNIEDASEVIEIDSNKLTISKRYSLKPCEEPTGIAIDAEHYRLFSGCHNKIMTVLDYKAGKVIATVPIGEGVDANAFDAGEGLVFSSNGEGTLTLVRETAGKFETETVNTQRGSRTMALDAKTHKIYLPAAEFAPAPAPTAEVPKPRPMMIKDSFSILVVGK